MRCYFLSFLWRVVDSPHWIPGSDVTRGEHPLDYELRAWGTYGKTHPGFEIKLVFFVEIPEDVWRRYTRELPGY